MSCVACAATSRSGRGCHPHLSPCPRSPTPKNLLCGSLDWPPPPLLSSLPPLPPLFPAPSGRPRPTPTTITRQHSRLPLPAPGTEPACQPPGSTGRAGLVHKPGDSSRLVWLLRYLTASQLASDVKEEEGKKSTIRRKTSKKIHFIWTCFYAFEWIYYVTIQFLKENREQRYCINGFKL